MSKASVQGFSLSDYCCAVIGVGGLGCNIAVHLAGAGVGTLILFDGDTVNESNLNRQFLYDTNDIGKKKVLAARERLFSYAPDVRVEAIPLKLKKDNIPNILKTADMIFLAVDNKAARKLISDFSEKNSIPLMLGGIDGFYGKTYLYLPGLTPPPENAGMTDGKKAEYNNSFAAGIIGSLQAATGIQYLLSGDASLGGRLTVYDKDTFSTLVINHG